MKRFSTAVICMFFVVTGVLVAQQTENAATKEDVQRLFDVLHSRQQAAVMLDAVKKQFQTILPQMMEKEVPNATPEEKQKMQEFIEGTYEHMFDTMPFEEMMEAMVPAYEHHLTHDEVQQLIQFYSSPIGQKFLTQLPAITSEAMQAETPVMQKWMSDQMSELQRRTEEFARSLRNQKKPDTPKQKS